MMLAPASTLLDWAARHSPERIVAAGVLALRICRYLSDGAPSGLASIPGLRVRASGHSERPLWHPSTGLYGFLRLPPGTMRIELDDPSGRYQAQAVVAQVPDRTAFKDALAAGMLPPPGSAGPRIVDVALRPSIAMALPPGTSALWGVVRDGERPVAGALLTLATVLQGLPDRVTGLSGRDGCYLLVLPAEIIDRSANPPGRLFARTLTVDAPRPALTEALAQQGFTAGQPANAFGLTAAERSALFMPRRFQLRDSGGTVHPQVGGQNPSASVSVGEQVRLDIELLP